MNTLALNGAVSLDSLTTSLPLASIPFAGATLHGEGSTSITLSNNSLIPSFLIALALTIGKKSHPNVAFPLILH